MVEETGKAITAAVTAWLENLTRAKWIECIEIQVNTAGQEDTTQFEFTRDFDTIEGIAFNFQNGVTGEIRDFKVNSESLFFDAGTNTDILTVRDHQNMSDRFFPVYAKVNRRQRLEITYRDTSSVFAVHTRKLYLLMTGPQRRA